MLQISPCASWSDAFHVQSQYAALLEANELLMEDLKLCQALRRGIITHFKKHRITGNDFGRVKNNTAVLSENFSGQSPPPFPPLTKSTCGAWKHALLFVCCMGTFCHTRRFRLLMYNLAKDESPGEAYCGLLEICGGWNAASGFLETGQAQELRWDLLWSCACALFLEIKELLFTAMKSS